MMLEMNRKDDEVATDGDLEGARRATGKSPSQTIPAPDPEVIVKTDRRRFTAKYKLSILEQADQCSGTGEVGALLRREGLYSSHLSNWRRLRCNGTLQGLASNKRGPKVNPNAASERENSRLKKHILKLEEELLKAHTIIDVQKKLSVILGATPNDENKS